VSPRAISLRLDPEAERALRVLTRTGRTRSEAIRASLIEAARRESDLQAEAAALAADEVDRAEAAEVAGLMESLRAPR
jgi:Arc/MetJ-type ribon-helix-helix transcriptional regulator